jgi:tellurite methyltransferase
VDTDASSSLVAVERAPWSPWDVEYASTPDRFIWGTRASSLARALTPRLGARARVLDLGCGEGRDSVFLAEQGYAVTGVELSLLGLCKATRLAAERGVRVGWVCAAMPDMPVRGPFDLVYSCGSIHYVARRDRGRLFERVRALTPRGGFHAHVVFTDRRIYREKNEVVHYFAPNELRRAYGDWSILRHDEGLISCAQDGTLHVHSVETVVARRP